MNPSKYKWVICICCTILMFSVVGLTSAAFSVYMPFLRDFNNFTNTQTSTLTTIRSLVAFFSMFALTVYYKKLNVRLGACIAGLAAAAGFTVMSFAGNNYIIYCLGCALNGFAYGFAGMVPITMIITRWFTGKKALALSICSAGSGIASFVVPPIVTAGVAAIGLSQTMVLEGCFIVVMMVLFFVFVRNAPKGGVDDVEEKSAEVQKGGAESAMAQQTDLETNRKISKAGLIVMMFAVILLGAVSVSGWGHISILFTTAGYDAAVVAGILSAGGICLTLGKFFYGFVTDKTTVFSSNFLFMGLIIVGNLLCCFANLHNDIMPFAAVIIQAIGYPIATVGVSLWATDLTTKEDMPRVLKDLQMCYVLGNLLCNTVPGVIADATGSYVPAYAMFTAMSVIVLFIVQAMYVKSGKTHAKKVAKKA